MMRNRAVDGGSATDGRQLELLADQAAREPASNPKPGARLARGSDEALIAAVPGAGLDDACALAAEAGRRQLDGAVVALKTLCRGFVGFGAHRWIPEQAAALEALTAIGGTEAARSVSEMIAKEIAQGPMLAVAVSAATRLGVMFPPAVALRLLRYPDPTVRRGTCDCVRPGADVAATLIALLTDRDPEVAIAAACALGRLGRGEALPSLKRFLNERPSPRVIEALVDIADEEAVVFLARTGRVRPELTACVLAALDEIDHDRAAVAASALRHSLSKHRDGDSAPQF